MDKSDSWAGVDRLVARVPTHPDRSNGQGHRALQEILEEAHVGTPDDFLCRLQQAANAAVGNCRGKRQTRFFRLFWMIRF
jgi:hypothetical protein